jgi:ribosomal protein S18 acetylase RimI-like enzyme
MTSGLDLQDGQGADNPTPRRDDILMLTALATVEDAAEILALQKAAYQSEALLYNSDSIPPLLQTLDEIQSQFATRLFLKAVEEERIVGSIRGYQDGTTCHIERLFVEPERRGRGIGSGLLEAIESHFPQAERFELFTGHKSESNLRLYERAGYRVFARKVIVADLALIFLEKLRQKA